MQIIHKIDDFLYIIFPEIRGGGNQLVISALEKFYTFGPLKPSITIDKDLVTIDIDASAIVSQEADYRKAVALCEKGKYSEAKPILKKLIDKNPTNSEYHRILGQILSDEGDQEEAINCLIDALRWNSSNGWALLMVGNIFAKFKNDVSTAMKYYDQALVANPRDNITINNIGANLMQQGKIEEAKKYFWKALKINNDYPNTHFALGMIAEMEDDLHSAFYSTIQSIKLNNKKDGLYENSVRQAFEISNRIIASGGGNKIFKEYMHKLELDGGTEIDIVEDTEIPTAAKIEFAENYGRPKHIVRYKPNYPAVEHLIIHELVHLEFVIDSRKVELNELFISKPNHKADFIKSLEPTIKKFHKMGISEDAIAEYCSGLFEGMNRQMYNTPIDLFIENFLYNEYAAWRPYQFLSLYALIQEGLKAVTDEKSVELSPKDILSKSKILNIVNAIQYKELYGIDFINDFKATPDEIKQANGFYAEYLEYKDDKEPAEEYELVKHWAEDLKLDKNFELVSENEFRNKTTDIDQLLESIEKDPFDLESNDPSREKDMDDFKKSQAKIGTNMAMVMFMVDALQYFEKMPKEKIKEIAYEIALQGTHGYRPDGKDYRISLMPGKLFSGYHILAYYYVSWMMALREMVTQLQLPYEEEYKMAASMYKPK